MEATARFKGIRGYFLNEMTRYFLGNYFCGLGLLSAIAQAQHKGEAFRRLITNLKSAHRRLEICEAPLELSLPELPFLSYH